MSSRIVAPASKLAFTSARPITTTAQAARPSHLLRPAGRAPSQLRQTSQTEDAAASASETSRPLTTVSVSTPRRPLSAAQTRLPPMQGFRFTTATASHAPQQHAAPAARRVDCVVLPNLAPPQGSNGDKVASLGTFAPMIYIPYIPATGAAPVVDDATAVIQASSYSSSAPTTATSAEEQGLADGAEDAAETVFVAAANPSAVAPMTEIEGIGADGLELFASGEAKHQQRRAGEDEPIRGLWAGLMDDVLGGASRGGSMGAGAA